MYIDFFFAFVNMTWELMENYVERRSAVKRRISSRLFYYCFFYGVTSNDPFPFVVRFVYGNEISDF